MTTAQHTPTPDIKFGVTQKDTGAFIKINLPSWESAKKAAKSCGGIPCKYFD